MSVTLAGVLRCALYFSRRSAVLASTIIDADVYIKATCVAVADCYMEAVPCMAWWTSGSAHRCPPL